MNKFADLYICAANNFYVSETFMPPLSIRHREPLSKVLTTLHPNTCNLLSNIRSEFLPSAQRYPVLRCGLQFSAFQIDSNRDRPYISVVPWLFPSSLLLMSLASIRSAQISGLQYDFVQTLRAFSCVDGPVLSQANRDNTFG